MYYIKCDGKQYTVEEVIEIIRDYKKRKAEQEASAQTDVNEK